MDTEDGFAMPVQGVEAGIAQFQAQLVFAPRSETPVALEAGGKSRALAQFASVNFRMNFQRDHETLPRALMARRVPRLWNCAG
jgi:hypothetical protein